MCKKFFLSVFKNINIISSDICGLGKSEKIRKRIKDFRQKYYHFPLGGYLTKKIIYNKLENIMEKIKNENYRDIAIIAIHLDLTESYQKDILNEFFFSFLITKFYSYNDNIINIPKDISIYIEIPNCFENYLDKFIILNIFKRENISFENMPKLNYSDEIIKKFKYILKIKSNEEIEELVKKKIGVQKYSYHQINIFIKIFLSQFNKFNSKIQIKDKDKDITEQVVCESLDCASYFIKGGFSRLSTEAKEFENKDYIDILSEIYDNDLYDKDIRINLLLYFIEKNKINRLFLREIISKEFKDSKDYLKKIKELLNLPNEVEKDIENKKSLLSILEQEDNNYVLTNDNFIKMILLFYRIKANVPVIIMGETGCGKTLLVIKLNQLLNNGKTTLEIININPNITDDNLYLIINNLNEKAKRLKDEELWIFFDDINTCLSLTLITQIFINRTFNGNVLSDNIRLIGACRPYRKRKENKEKYGLSFSDDNDNELVYLVNPLPQSLFYYIFNIGSISDKDEEKYIYGMIQKIFIKEEQNLHEITVKLISKCHNFLREIYDISIVSLREINRFCKLFEFFKEYFRKKNEYENIQNNDRNNKLRSIICSIYLCYYTRLTNDVIKVQFEHELKYILLKLINNNEEYEVKGIDIMVEITNKDFKKEILHKNKFIQHFSDFIKIEQYFLIEQINLDKGIVPNILLRENIFILFVSLLTKIPLFIMGKSGSGKSLSVQLIINAMKGKYSKNKFFKKFPNLIETNFHSSEYCQPEDIKKLFEKGKNKLEYYKKNNLELPISLIIFDNLKLTEKSKSNPLSLLNYNLENISNEKNICFIGISNYILSADIMNRILILSTADLDKKLDELIFTSSKIAESIDPRIKNEKIFELLSLTYYHYKRLLKFIKELTVLKQYEKEKQNNNNNSIDINDEDEIEKREEEKREEERFECAKQTKEFKDLMKKENKIKIDFHGYRDFYYLIKGIANTFRDRGDISDEEKVNIIIDNIERNFGGIEYEIDIDFNLRFDDIKKEIYEFRNIVEYYFFYEENGIFKLNSIFLFKQLYNIQCEKMEQYRNIEIDKNKINDYNIYKCINNNVNDYNSRYLLIEVNSSLNQLVYQYIKLNNPFKESIILYQGSPFINDNNNDYIYKKLKEIIKNLNDNKLIIIENLNQIHPYLYDLYDMNYQIIEQLKYTKIYLDFFNQFNNLINNRIKIIFLVDKTFYKNSDLSFLNRFEKISLKFDNLLDDHLKAIERQLIEQFRLKHSIRRYRKSNYSLKDLLINCSDEDIHGLIYYFSRSFKLNKNDSDDEDFENERIDANYIKEKVIDKIYKILPQDIISILPQRNIIKRKYFEHNYINNFNDYIQSEENKEHKISIIYTFTSLSNALERLKKNICILASEIKSENEFKNIIEDKKIENDKFMNEDYICIHFEQSNSKKIKFITNFILNTFKDDNYNYIIFLHINRNFNPLVSEKIYSIPNINPDINQIFIDNLYSTNNIRLNHLLSNDIKNILGDYKEELKLDEEFNIQLVNFLKKELNEKEFDNDLISEYIEEIMSYINEEYCVKDEIIETSYRLIDIEDEDVNDIIDKIFEENLININTIDIASQLIEFIKGEIFSKHLKHIFKNLEDNNILTTLIENKKTNYKYINKNIINEIIDKYLDEINLDNNNKYYCKFLFKYNVPCFYNFYIYISNYINKNIVVSFFNNEKKLRELYKNDLHQLKDFHDKEVILLDCVNDSIRDNKFILEIIDKIPYDLILKDYITYYLQKYRNSVDIYDINDIYHQIIELMLKIRFNDENPIIKGNSNININILLIKIIWIESNINHILNILKIIETTSHIFNNNEKILYDKIVQLYKEGSIKYIVNERYNPEISREVNECYYIILAIICHCIVSEEIKLSDKSNENEIEINYYYYLLKEVNEKLKIFKNDLFIYLNEIYIIDEFIKIVEFGICNKNNCIDKINEIKNYIIENFLIIRKYNDNEEMLVENLKYNFENIYNLVTEMKEIYKNDTKYFDNIRYIFFTEIKKIYNIDYRYMIICNLIEENELIKKSYNIFQYLLRNYFKNEKFKNIRNDLLNSENNKIIKLIESKLINNNIYLEETFLYLFENKSLNYYNYIFENNLKIINLEDKPLEILKDCIEFLEYYINKPKMLANKLKEICKLFCLGYIKAFCYTFIKMFNDNNPKWKDPKKIIHIFNGNTTICKMLRLYIYKIIYNNESFEIFFDENRIDKYKLKDYKDFKEFINTKELSVIYKFDHHIKTLKYDYYGELYHIVEKNRKINFSSKVKIREIDIEEYNIDNFYIASFNLILENYFIKSTEMNINFYNNICKPLFEKDKILSKAIELLYNEKKLSEIKKIYNIKNNSIIPFLFGYRYCINELSYKNNKGIYYPLYTRENDIYLKEKLYPGNDTKLNLVYSNIINHFKFRQNEGCYVCLCNSWYYHSVPSGFPGKKELNMSCPKCNNKIGCCNLLSGEIKTVKRNNYFRIFKDENEIQDIKKIEINRHKLMEINYMTLKDFKEKYIYNLIKEERGVFISTKESFKNGNKIIRNLSQISYRLLNYILYTHLFFAKLITNQNKFNKYLPEGLSWIETLDECWNILQNELLKINIFSIEEFMNYIFVDLFPILNKEKAIDKFDDLIRFEDKLEKQIQEIIKKYEKISFYKKDNNEDDKNSCCNLLKEKYESEYYQNEDFPFYRYFYYTDYLNEKYIIEKLEYMDKSKYPVLKMYLDYNNEKEDKNDYIINNINLFNSVLNMLYQTYFNKISRKYSEKTKLKDIDIYQDNKKLFDDFINFYNNIKIKEIKVKKRLNNNNPLCDFFIDEANEYGRTYKIIYEYITKQQNKKIGDLIDIKIENGIFDINYKNEVVNVQQINENEIFNLKLPKYISFIDMLLNSSYRKILDLNPLSYQIYKEYVIDFDLIEENMTDILFKNKKLLSNNIIEFFYNNEIFNNQVSNVITLFKKRYIYKDITFDDKLTIYKFCIKNKNNIILHKNIIQDFMALFEFLNNKRKDKDINDIKEETKIYEILDEIKDMISKNFSILFEKNDNLIICKISSIFDYYMKSIFEDVISNIKEYQKELEKEKKEKIDDYFKNNNYINKKDLACAIRLFITLVFFPEEDKEIKIKNNNNIINYLKSPDLWKNDLYNNEKFNKNLNELKSINIQINQVISLYETLGKDIEDNFFYDVKQKIEEEMNLNNIQESEEEDDNDDDEDFDDDRKILKSDSENNN